VNDQRTASCMRGPGSRIGSEAAFPRQNTVTPLTMLAAEAIRRARMAAALHLARSAEGHRATDDETSPSPERTP